MIPSKPIFISAVSKELKSARGLVADTLRSMGYPTEDQEIFGLEQGDLRDILRKKIDKCAGVFQLVGQCYGAEPPSPAKEPNRMSYTQFEAEYAKKRGKPVWYFLLAEDFPTDPHEQEPEELRSLQAQYRTRIAHSDDLYQPAGTTDALEARVRRYQKELDRFRRRAVVSSTLSICLLAAVLLSVGWLLWALVIAPKPPMDPDRVPRGVRLSVDSGFWARDEVIAARVANRVKGTLLGEENYKIQLEIKNPTTMPVIITKIVVLTRNDEASQLFGKPDPVLHTSTVEITYDLDANGATTVPMTLSQFLPKQITVRIFHSHSDTPSEFYIDLNSTTLPMPKPRYLARDQVMAGYDSAESFKVGLRLARNWSSDAQLMAAFPADFEVYLDPESRLKFWKVTRWSHTYYSAAKNRAYMMVVPPGDVEPVETRVPPSDIPPADTPQPNLSYQEALDIANRASLLSADWETIRFGTNKIGGKSACAWRLPYRDPRGLPIHIDAVTGHQLVPDIEGGYKTIELDPVPATP